MLLVPIRMTLHSSNQLERLGWRVSLGSYLLAEGQHTGSTTAVVDKESGGFHVFEVHAQSLGLGFGALLICALVGFILFKCLHRFLARYGFSGLLSAPQANQPPVQIPYAPPPPPQAPYIPPPPPMPYAHPDVIQVPRASYPMVVYGSNLGASGSRNPMAVTTNLDKMIG